jgi:hypothetical protein
MEVSAVPKLSCRLLSSGDCTPTPNSQPSQRACYHLSSEEAYIAHPSSQVYVELDKGKGLMCAVLVPKTVFQGQEYNVHLEQMVKQQKPGVLRQL